MFKHEIQNVPIKVFVDEKILDPSPVEKKMTKLMFNLLEPNINCLTGLSKMGFDHAKLRQLKLAEES